MIKFLSNSLKFAFTEYKRQIFDVRILIIGILVIVINNLIISPLNERAEKLNDLINVFEPYISVGNSGMILMLLPSVFLIVISDFPKLGSYSQYIITRTGKKAFLTGEIICGFMLSFSFNFAILALTVASSLSTGKFSDDWSDTVTKFASFYPDESNSYIDEIMPSNLYNQFEIIPAICNIFILITLYLFLLSLVLVLFKILNKKILGIAVCFLIIMFGVITSSLKNEIMWLFPMANTVIWLHYTEILSKPIYPMLNSYTYFILLIGFLIFVSYLIFRKTDFIYHGE